MPSNRGGLQIDQERRDGDQHEHHVADLQREAHALPGRALVAFEHIQHQIVGGNGRYRNQQTVQCGHRRRDQYHADDDEHPFGKHRAQEHRHDQVLAKQVARRIDQRLRRDDEVREEPDRSQEEEQDENGREHEQVTPHVAVRLHVQRLRQDVRLADEDGADDEPGDVNGEHVVE